MKKTAKRLIVECILLTLALALTGGQSYAAGKSSNKSRQVRDRYVLRIPAGFEIIVRVDRDIVLRNARMGDVFTGTIDRDVYSGNQLLVRRGDRGEIQLHTVGGRTDEVGFRLVSIAVNGGIYDVRSDLAREYAERQRDDLGVLGKTAIGAATGAAIGAIAGGGRGAAIGAAAGAGGGLLWSAATMKQARVPAGTRLRFSLADPVYLH
ncbi:MAG: hypothetical protein GX443_07865 [Deltaproteobacteria bacterium]|nr:hypothetical protein [Deltaproteobacteria bacterium]